LFLQRLCSRAPENIPSMQNISLALL
jgi:hypothetical protein